MKEWTRFISLRIMTIGGFFVNLVMTFEIHKRRQGVSFLAVRLRATQLYKVS